MRRASLWIILVLSVFMVHPLAAQEPPYSVTATISNPMPFVGQQTIYRFEVYTSVTLENANYLSPDFEGLWRTEMERQDNLVAVALFPTRQGEYLIEPATLIVPENVFRGEIILQTEPITINALPLPDGAPPKFSGGVGQFTMTAALDRQTATQGEPLKLSLTIAGTGNVEQLPAPELPIPADWSVYANPTTYRSSIQNGLLVGEKTFEWLITPSQAGQQTLPQITLWYFDPDISAMGYRSVGTSSVTLDILPGTPVAQSDQAGASVPADPVTLLRPKPIPAVLQTGQNELSVLFWLLIMIPPIAAVSVWLWMRQQLIKQRTQVQRQVSAALQKAQIALQSAAKTQPDSAYRAISQTIYTYFGDKLQQQPAGLSQADLRTAMDSHFVPAQVADVAVMCLEWADSGRYAPGGAADVQTLVERALKTLTAIDAAWK